MRAVRVARQAASDEKPRSGVDHVDHHREMQTPLHGHVDAVAPEGCRRSEVTRQTLTGDPRRFAKHSTRLDGNVISFVRRAKRADNFLLFVCAFAPQVRPGYQVGVPREGVYQEILSSDAEQFGGSGIVNRNPIRSQQGEVQGKHHFISITLPPLAVAVFRRISD